MKSEIYGAWAYYCPHKEHSKFPSEDDKLIGTLSGRYTDITEIPEKWKKEMINAGANIIAIGLGDCFLVYAILLPNVEVVKMHKGEKEKRINLKEIIEKCNGIDMEISVSMQLKDIETLQEYARMLFDRDIVGMFKNKPDGYTVLLHYGCKCKAVFDYRGKEIPVVTVYIAPCRKHKKAVIESLEP